MSKYFIIIILICNISLLWSQHPAYNMVKLAVKNEDTIKLNQIVEFERSLAVSPNDSVATAFKGFIDCEDFYVIRYLVENGYLGLGSKLERKWTPLLLACQCNEKKFIEKNAKKEDLLSLRYVLGATSLMLAAQNANKSLVKIILQKAPESIQQVDITNRNVLFYAVEGNSLKLVKYLIKKGANPETIGSLNNRAVSMGILKGNFRMVKYFIKNHSKNFDDKYKSQIKGTAALGGKLKIVKYLYKLYGFADINKKGVFEETVLFDAAHNAKSSYSIGDLENKPLKRFFNNPIRLIDYLIEHGADVNVQDRDGETALFKCKEYLDLVKYFIEKGTDINLKNKEGKTVLGKLVDYIVTSQKMIVFGETQYWDSGLIDFEKIFKVVQYLEDNGSEIKYPYSNGMSYLLFEATKTDNRLVLQKLIKYGMDINTKDLNNKTPLDYAMEQKQEGLISFLKKLIIKQNGNQKIKVSTKI